MSLKRNPLKNKAASRSVAYGARTVAAKIRAAAEAERAPVRRRPRAAARACVMVGAKFYGRHKREQESSFRGRDSCEAGGVWLHGKPSTPPRRECTVTRRRSRASRLVESRCHLAFANAATLLS